MSLIYFLLRRLKRLYLSEQEIIEIYYELKKLNNDFKRNS